MRGGGFGGRTDQRQGMTQVMASCKLEEDAYVQQSAAAVGMIKVDSLLLHDEVR